MRKFLYNLSATFNPLRWALFVMVISFVAVVGVYEYIDLSASVAITFSSVETVFILLTNPANLAYIFLPLYLFIVCGLPNRAQFGYLEVVRYRSRGHWLFHKWLVLAVYTLLFFVGLMVIFTLIATQAFPYQSVWSSDFILLQVSLGQGVSNFVHPPLYTIGMSLLGACLLYFFAGSVTMLCGLISHSEPLSLFLSMVVGLVLAGLCNYVWFYQRSVATQGMQALVFALLSLALIGISYPIVTKSDLQFSGKGGCDENRI